MDCLVVPLIGLVGIRFFGDARFGKGFLFIGIEFYVPQQTAVFQALLGFFGVLFNEFV